MFVFVISFRKMVFFSPLSCDTFHWLQMKKSVCYYVNIKPLIFYSLIFCSQFLTSAFPIDIWKWLHLHHRVIRVYPLISLLSYVNIDPVCCKEWPHYLHWKQCEQVLNLDWLKPQKRKSSLGAKFTKTVTKINAQFSPVLTHDRKDKVLPLFVGKVEAVTTCFNK